MNYNAVKFLVDVTHLQSETYGKDGTPLFKRADMLRSKVGYTFMRQGRLQGALLRAGYKRDHVASLKEWIEIAVSLRSETLEVTEVEPV